MLTRCKYYRIINKLTNPTNMRKIMIFSESEQNIANLQYYIGNETTHITTGKGAWLATVTSDNRFLSIDVYFKYNRDNNTYQCDIISSDNELGDSFKYFVIKTIAVNADKTLSQDIMAAIEYAKNIIVELEQNIDAISDYLFDVAKRPLVNGFEVVVFDKAIGNHCNSFIEKSGDWFTYNPFGIYTHDNVQMMIDSKDSLFFKMSYIIGKSQEEVIEMAIINSMLKLSSLNFPSDCQK